VVLLVDPGPGHHPGPVERADVPLVGLDHGVDHVAGHEALLDEQRFDGRHPALDRAGVGRVMSVVPVVVTRHAR
jgi:hypothetical protein